jgi:hypothetical protein
VYAAKDCTKDSGSSTSYRWGGFKDKSPYGACGKYSDNKDGATCVYDVGADTLGRKPISSGCREATSGKKAVCFECGTGTYDLMAFEYSCVGTTTSSWTGCGDKLVIVKPPVVTCTEGAVNYTGGCRITEGCPHGAPKLCRGEQRGKQQCVGGLWKTLYCKPLCIKRKESCP